MEKSCFSVGSVVFRRGYAAFDSAVLSLFDRLIVISIARYVSPEFSREGWWWAVLLLEFG